MGIVLLPGTFDQYSNGCFWPDTDHTIEERLVFPTLSLYFPARTKYTWDLGSSPRDIPSHPLLPHLISPSPVVGSYIVLHGMHPVLCIIGRLLSRDLDRQRRNPGGLTGWNEARGRRAQVLQHERLSHANAKGAFHAVHLWSASSCTSYFSELLSSGLTTSGARDHGQEPPPHPSSPSPVTERLFPSGHTPSKSPGQMRHLQSVVPNCHVLTYLRNRLTRHDFGVQPPPTISFSMSS
ncbi:hypothetical protein EDB80DRAFT_9474 [Ilyonectria destructans]|nr:hypothetical protein EDB80DRAFT_9474 [Ilyonectria destructans]